MPKCKRTRPRCSTASRSGCKPRGFRPIRRPPLAAFFARSPRSCAASPWRWPNRDADSQQGPLVRSLWMLIADFLAAAIPILPFGFLAVPQGRVVSATVTTLLLVALGVGRAKIGGRPMVRTVIETVSIGVAAAAAGVGIGVWISQIFT
ncbi:MAG TPA: VIT1/CCC1 transporter family protein [Xanthobacteraceae bacterium]|nr:VIT1/CCC1 transporter family protein [Xanthobacteraceae bacterium]